MVSTASPARTPANTPPPCEPPITSFSSPAGLRVARSILYDTLKFDPHDYQLEGVCKLLDGVNLLALIPTGGGKTGFIFMAILLLRAARTDPRFHTDLRKKLPIDGAAVIVLPTNSVEMEMATKFVDTYKISSVAINSDELEKARAQGRDLWALAETDAEAVFLSPEHLRGAHFETLLRSKKFWRRAWLLGVDELQFLDSWGPSFRPDFLQIGNVYARMPAGTRLLGMTATLLAGAPAARVLRFVGFRDGYYHTIQRSNIRNNIRIAFCPLSAPLTGLVFPDLKWILKPGRKTIIFVKTINLAFRVWAYLWTEAGRGTAAEKRIRFRRYTTLESEEYNAETRRLMHDDLSCQVIIATDRLSVGVDFREVWYGIMLDDRMTADRFFQGTGRAGRDAAAVTEALGIWYHNKNAVDVAKEVVAAGALKSKPDTEPRMEYAMARLLLAPCKRAMQNELYANPTTDPPCTCASCTSRASRTTPVSHAPSSLPSADPSGTAVGATEPSPAASCLCCGLPADHPAHALSMAAAKPKRTRKAKAALTELQISALSDRLVEWRESVYLVADDVDTFDTPAVAFLPPPVIRSIARQYHLIKTPEDLSPLVMDVPYIREKTVEIFDLLTALKPELESLRAAAAAKRSKVDVHTHDRVEPGSAEDDEEVPPLAADAIGDSQAAEKVPSIEVETHGSQSVPLRRPRPKPIRKQAPEVPSASSASLQAPCTPHKEHRIGLQVEPLTPSKRTNENMQPEVETAASVTPGRRRSSRVAKRVRLA